MKLSQEAQRRKNFRTDCRKVADECIEVLIARLESAPDPLKPAVIQMVSSELNALLKTLYRGKAVEL